MNPEIQTIWQEIRGDISSAAAVWQFAIIAVAMGVAWLINGALRSYVLKRVQENRPIEEAKLAIGGINRALFPLTTLFFVWMSKLILADFQHVGLLALACRLLLAMAAIRLIVYAVRYIFPPSGLLKTLENVISWCVWVLLALHLTGYLSHISEALEDIQFNIGKTPVNLLLILQGILTVVATLFIALWLSRLIENKLMRTEDLSANMRVVMVKLIRIFFMAIAVLIALSAVGLDITLLSVFGGALGIGLGFGLQKIASNYVSGFIILLDKSMQIGDVITTENHYGVVTDLRSRYMVLRKLDGTEVVIPNETFITSSVINHSFTDRKARVQMPIQISYESNLELAMRLMLKAATMQQRVLKDPKPVTYIIAFGENGIDLMMHLWILDQEEGSMELKSSVYLDIWHAFKENSIVIPCPQREVRLVSRQ